MRNKIWRSKSIRRKIFLIRKKIEMRRDAFRVKEDLLDSWGAPSLKQLSKEFKVKNETEAWYKF
jgi:hypothetical protein|tara:strand:- start:6764 stop:6955 length:192 start_codon:yes stop_codon:yes gene_type:complete